MAAVGLHPRLAHMLLKARERGWLATATALAVLISERDPLDRRAVGSDLLRRIDWLRSGTGGERAPLQALQAQLRRQLEPVATGRSAARPPAGEEPEAGQVARLLAWAYPERLALKRDPGQGRFLLRSGRGAWLPPEDPLAGEASLVVAGLDGEGRDARVLLAAPLPRPLLEEIALAEGREERRAFWDDANERVRRERVRCLGALVLERHPWDGGDGSGDDAAAVRAALTQGLSRLGLEALPWCRRSRQLQQRLALAHRHLGPPWPARDRAILAADPLAWLEPWLEGMASRQDLQQLDLIEALWGDLPWERRQQLDRLLPETLTVPSGRRVPLDYGGEEPVLAVKLQEMFGATATPSVLGGALPVTVHLLSPAGRPAAITRDLAGFWQGGYAEVRRELRGRYPRHPWPEDPRTAPATAHTKARLAREERGSGPG
jgi:ATP-dependent helicase HrpB